MQQILLSGGCRPQSTGSQVKYLLYTLADYDDTASQMSEKETPRSVPGRMKLHAVVPSLQSLKKVFIRNVSCYCLNCMLEVDSTCTGWEALAVSKQVGNNDHTNDGDL